jgi:hypothetical protein
MPERLPVFDAALASDEGSPPHPVPPAPDARAVTGDWWDAAWPRRRPITITHAGQEALVDFPVGVALAPLGITGMAARGLRFVDGGGKVLAHEVEYESPDKPAVAWVRVPRIPAHASGVALWMYSGNAAAPPVPAGEVWPAPYAAVWHFAGDARDATGHHQDGSKLQARFGGGPLGAALLLDGARREHVGVGPNSGLVSGAAAVTVSLWAQHQGVVHDGQDIILGIGTAATSGHLSRVSVALSPELGLIGEANPDEGAWDVTNSSPNSVPNGQWHHLAVVIDVSARTILLYENGVPLGAPFRGRWRAAAFAATPANRITIGCEEDESKSFFTGMLDELRVETTARSPAWIAAQALAAAGKLATVGGEEIAAP